MKEKNLVSVRVKITEKTLYHLNNMAQNAGYKNIGRVIDKLVREKRISLRSSINGEFEAQNGGD